MKAILEPQWLWAVKVGREGSEKAGKGKQYLGKSGVFPTEGS
jgi:hypothetical protein